MHLLNLSGKIKGAKILCIYFYLVYQVYLVCQSARKINELTDRNREQKPWTGKDIPTKETLLGFCSYSVDLVPGCIWDSIHFHLKIKVLFMAIFQKLQEI